MPQRPLLLIDGDPPVYRAGAAAEEHTYDLVVSDEAGELHQMHMDCDADVKAWVKENPDWALESKELCVVPHPEAYARQIMRTAMSHCVRSVRDRHGEVEVRMFLTGPGNFREEIAKTRPYKGNRDRNKRPVHYQLLRDYLVEHWDAEVIEGCEADDAISIIAHENAGQREVIIASNDKDLDQIPGHHYNYVDHVHYSVDSAESKLYFYQQVLSGDATDNIPGAKGVGTGRARAMIDSWVQQGVHELHIWDLIVGVYEERGVSGEVGDRTAEEVALEQARLVYMQRRWGEMWEPVRDERNAKG